MTCCSDGCLWRKARKPERSATVPWASRRRGRWGNRSSRTPPTSHRWPRWRSPAGRVVVWWKPRLGRHLGGGGRAVGGRRYRRRRQPDAADLARHLCQYVRQRPDHGVVADLAVAGDGRPRQRPVVAHQTRQPREPEDRLVDQADQRHQLLVRQLLRPGALVRVHQVQFAAVSSQSARPKSNISDQHGSCCCFKTSSSQWLVVTMFPLQLAACFSPRLESKQQITEKNLPPKSNIQQR